MYFAQVPGGGNEPELLEQALEPKGVPTLCNLVYAWFGKYYSAPDTAASITALAYPLAGCPTHLQEQICMRLSYLPLRALQRTKWCGRLHCTLHMHMCHQCS